MPLCDKETKLIDRMLEGDRAALARLITYAESRHGSLPEILKRLASSAKESYIVGITGPPGAGKSTLTNKLIKYYRDEGNKVGVLAVDPTSPFSGGAILGDRIRMHEHAMDDGVFIRSISTGGAHGGIARATNDIMRLYGAFGMDYLIVETVGVGQTELDIVRVADTVVVVLVPEAGDSVQTMKAGLMEIADIFVVNKADREGAELISAEIKQIVSINSREGAWEIPVLLTSAIRSEGIEAVLKSVEEHRMYQRDKGLLREKRERRREDAFREIVKGLVENRVADRLKEKDVSEISSRVKSGEIDPYEAAELVVSKIL